MFYTRSSWPEILIKLQTDKTVGSSAGGFTVNHIKKTEILENPKHKVKEEGLKCHGFKACLYHPKYTTVHYLAYDGRDRGAV